MKKHSLRGILFLYLASLMTLNPVWSSSNVSTSAFIEGKVALNPDPDRHGAYSYHKAGLDLGRYNRIVILPVEIWIHPNSKYNGISPDELKALADTFREILVDELEPAYPVVDKTGPGTMVVRLAITGIKLKKKKRGLFGYTPIGFVAGATTGAYRKITLKDATIEAELLDAGTSKRLGVLVDTSIAEATEKMSWKDIEKSLRFYAKRFRGRLDKAHANGR